MTTYRKGFDVGYELGQKHGHNAAMRELSQWILKKWEETISNRPLGDIYRQNLDGLLREFYRRVTKKDIPAEGGKNWVDKYFVHRQGNQ